LSQKLTIPEQINKDYRKYALYVIQSRGIPNFYDGLTPVQRIILQMSPNSFDKTLGVVGSVFKTGLYHHGDCLAGDTRINLADGTSIRIEDWYEKNPESDLLVESMDTETGEKTIGLGHSPRIGQISDDLFEIELDSGEVIKCTSNHPFYVNGEWIKAEDLKEGYDIKDFYITADT